MKILYLIKAYTRKAGTERVLCDKMNYLVEHGYEIHLVTYSQGNHPYAFPLNKQIIHHDLNIRFIDLSRQNIVKRLFGHLILRSRFKQSLQILINEVKPDVLITTTYQLKLTNLILSVKTCAVKLIESHISFNNVTISEEYFREGKSRFFAFLMDSFFLQKIGQFDRLIVLTKGDFQAWTSHNVSNIRIIPNPVTSYPEMINEDTADDRHRIICAGRLHEQKGFDLLISAFSLISDKCPGWIIDIFGEGEEESKLRNLIKSSGLEKRIYINAPKDDIYSEYQNSSFYVLSSRYEGFALVLNEAMSCGLPCVAFNCEYGPEESIANNENGLLVENGNVEGLSEAILWMINHPDERLRMGRNARKSSARYAKDKIMKMWEDLFEECVS